MRESELEKLGWNLAIILFLKSPSLFSLHFFSLVPFSIRCIYPLSLFIAFLEFLSGTKNIKKKKRENERKCSPWRSFKILFHPNEMTQCQSVWLAIIACCGNKSSIL